MTYVRCVTEVPIKTDNFLHLLFSLELKYWFFCEERIHKTHTHTHTEQTSYMYFFLPWRKSPSGPRPTHYRGFMITLRHTTLHRTPLDEWSARGRDLYVTKNTHKRPTAMPPGGIRTHNPSKRGAADPRLSPRCHWDRQVTCTYRLYVNWHNALGKYEPEL